MKKIDGDPLKRIEEYLKKCVKCGACRANCPAFAVFGRETSVARGKIALAQHLLKDDIELNEQTFWKSWDWIVLKPALEKNFALPIMTLVT